jgi:hypothetical protein
MTNEAELQEFFTNTIPDQIHLTAIRPDSQDIVTRDFGTNVGAAIECAMARNAEGMNVYFTANRVKDGVNKKPTKDNIEGIRFIHVDIDPPKDGSAWDIKAAHRRLMEHEPRPSTVICSGNGLQALWRTRDCTLKQAEAINSSLIKTHAGDTGTHNADRLLRVPGLINYPNKKKEAAGRNPVLAFTAEKDDGSVYTAAELIEKLGTETDAVRSERKAGVAAALGHYEYASSKDLGLAADDNLRNLIDAPKCEDRSADTYRVACEMGRRGYTREQIAGVLLNPENAINAHCADQAEPERAARRAIDAAFAQEDVMRRRQQRERTRMIGDGSDEIPSTEIFTVDEMLARFVYIKDGEQVSDRYRLQSRLLLKEFRNATAGSSQDVVIINKVPKRTPCVELWLRHPDRLDAETVTFRAGHGEMTTAPNGQSALNLWAPPVRTEAPADWAEQSRVFVDHISWLFGEHSEAFLDWLAHIEQKPGQLPHFGWLHISKVHGKGRGWISSVLARLWRGNVAASFDLVATLVNGFNGRLSRCLLAIVDEIHEGGNSTYRHAQTLRQMVTAEERLINKKYGRQHVEWNSLRWLIFSNHISAIPLDENDRRFYVVDHDGPVRPPEYYSSLYAKLEDPQFISSLAKYLQSRDISGFNPGASPPITAAKKALIAASMSEYDTVLAEMAERWPVDVISWEEIKDLCGEHVPKGAAARHALERAGLVKVGKIRLPLQCFGSEISKQTPIYAIRNHSTWIKASPEALRNEINRCTRDQKDWEFLCETYRMDDGSDLV